MVSVYLCSSHYSAKAPRGNMKMNELGCAPRLYLQKLLVGGFPGGSVVKNPPANAGETGLSPEGPGRPHMPWSN